VRGHDDDRQRRKRRRRHLQRSAGHRLGRRRRQRPDPARQLADHERSARYSGNFSRSSSYDISTSGNYTPRHFNSTWPTTPSAYLVTSDQGEPAVYNGNYLNWVYFTATATQRAAIPVVTRIQASKAVVNTVLGNITGCRFAIEIFNGSTGGNIIGPFGTSVASLQSMVTSVRANSYTPLAESMITAWNYFRTSDANAPIQSACQKTFVIIVTDGLPTMDTTVPSYITDANRNGYYLDDVTKYMYRNDARSDLDGIQNVATFTIGFNVDASLLQTAADLGGGDYFSISDATGLMGALTSSFNTIAARVSAGAAVSVVASEDRTNNRLYRARYQSQTWKGYLEAFNLPFHGGDSPLWEAGALLVARSASSRTLLTSTTGTNTYPFTRANAASLVTLLAATSTRTPTASSSTPAATRCRARAAAAAGSWGTSSTPRPSRWGGRTVSTTS
jgi:type IV pilus assembly protein PilY1